VSRRSVLIASMRRNSKQKGAPHIIIMPAWVLRDGEPVVLWALDARAPTKEEIASAVARWKLEQAAAKPTDEIRDANAKLTQQPGQGAGEEENEQ
jgi:hypothetical protein